MLASNAFVFSSLAKGGVRPMRVCLLAALSEKSRGAFSSEIGTMTQTLAGSSLLQYASVKGFFSAFVLEAEKNVFPAVNGFCEQLALS